MAHVTKGAMQVMALEIDENGQVRKKMMKLDREGQLENTLIQALYPGIRVATVDVPQQPLDLYQQARVEQALAKLSCDGVSYRLIGASGSAKSGSAIGPKPPSPTLGFWSRPAKRESKPRKRG